MMKLASVAIMVRDEKKATKWWKEKLGFRVVTRYPHWHTVASKGAGVRLHLCIDGKPEKGNSGFMFTVASASRTEKALRRKGVRITMPTTKEEWGTYFMFADPDGNEFWVMEG